MAVSLDFSDRFAGAVGSYNLEGDWPAGLSIDSLGEVTGTPTTQGFYRRLRVSAIGPLGAGKAYTNFFDMAVTAFGALVLALNGECIGVGVGTGGLTTTHTSDNMVKDYDGIWRTLSANEPVWNGARIVRNLLQNSEDLEDATWNASGVTVTGSISDPDDGTSAVTLTRTGANGLFYDNGFAVNGETNVLSWWIRRRTGTGGIQLYTGKDNTQATSITSEVTSSWKRFTPDVSVVTSTSGRCGIKLTVDGDEVDIWHPQIEPADGISNQVPSEYVPTTGIVSMKAFANHNGNTVATNVVTESIGDLLSVLPRLRFIPAATSECLQSRDLTASWSYSGTKISVIADAIGIDSIPNKATTITTILTDIDNKVTQNISGHSTRQVASFRLKKTTFATTFPGIRLFVDASNRAAYTVDTDNGTITERTDVSNAGTYNAEINDDGNFWNIIIQLDSSSTIAVAVFCAVNTDASGTWTSTASGSIIVGNVDVYLDQDIAHVRGLPPIFTTTAAVSIDRVAYTFNIANHEASDSLYSMELAPSVLDADWFELSFSGTTDRLLIQGSTTQFRIVQTTDGGIGTSNTDPDEAINVLGKYAAMYSAIDSLRTVNCRGNYLADQSFSDLSLSGTELNLCLNSSYNEFAVDVVNLHRYDITSLQNSKDILDEILK